MGYLGGYPGTIISMIINRIIKDDQNDETGSE